MAKQSELVTLQDKVVDLEQTVEELKYDLDYQKGANTEQGLEIANLESAVQTWRLAFKWTAKSPAVTIVTGSEE